MNSSPACGWASFAAGAALEVALPGGVFTARRLGTASDLRRAYVLVSMAHPEILPRRWFDTARRSLRLRPERGGLIVLRDRRGVVHALFRYKVEPSWLGGHGRTLRLDEIVIAQLPGNGAMTSLAACAQSLAASLRCASVSLDVPATEGAVAAQGGPGSPLQELHAAGFRHAAAVMVQLGIVASADPANTPANIQKGQTAAV